MKHLTAFLYFSFVCTFLTSAQQQVQQYVLFDLNQSKQLNPAYFLDTKWSINLPGFYNQWNGTPLALDEIVAENTSGSRDWVIAAQLDQLAQQNELRNVLQIGGLGFTYQTESELQWSVQHIVHLDAYVEYPKSLIQMLWETLPSAAPLDHQMQVLAYHELGVAVSKRLSDGLQIGGRLKLLNGIDQISTERAELQLEAAQLQADYRLNTGSFLEQDDLGNFNLDGLPQRSLSDWFSRNFGYAFDLGVQAQMEQWQIGASLIDIGQLFWRNNIRNYAFEGTFPATSLTLLNEYLAGERSFEMATDSLRQIFEVTETNIPFRTTLAPKFYGHISYFPQEQWQLSAVVYGEWFNNSFAPALSLSSRFQPNSFLHLGLSYNIYEQQFNQIGGSVILNLKPFQIFALSNSLTKFINWRKHEVVDVQFGMNLVFGE